MLTNGLALTPVIIEVMSIAVRVCKVRGPTRTRDVPSANAIKIITYSR